MPLAGRYFATVSITSLLAIHSHGLAQDWPQFRGPNGSGVSTGTKALPTEFGPKKNLIWRTEVPFARSSPVVGGGKVFLTAVENEKLTTLALNLADGRVDWRREITRERVSPVYKSNDAASPSPVTDGKNVYAFFPDFGLVSYGPKGGERWRLPLGPFDVFYGLAASPILAGGAVLLNCDSRTGAFLIAVDAATGKIRWRTERTDVRFEGHATPVVHDAQHVLVLGPNRVDAYALSNGERVWWKRGLAFLPIASPLIEGNTAIVATWGTDAPAGPSYDEWLKSDTNKDGRLSKEELKDFDEFGAIDRNRDGFIDRAEWDQLRNAGLGEYGMVAIRLGGRGEIGGDAVAWREKKNYSSMSTALVYRNVLYLAKGGGVLASLNPRTGEVYKVDRSKEALGEYYSSPVAGDGKVFFASEPGTITVLRAAPQWEILAVNPLGDEIYATPAISEGRILVRTRSALYAFGSK